MLPRPCQRDGSFEGSAMCALDSLAWATCRNTLSVEKVRANQGSLRTRRGGTLAGAAGWYRIPLLALRVCVVERSVSSRGCETHTWKEVVPQEAVEADREATTGREPSMTKGCLGQLSESAGHNASERRAGPENASRGSRPSTRKGKANAGEVKHNRTPSVPPG